MEWIITHFFKLTTVLLTIILIRQGLYPQQTRYFFSQVPRYLKQWARWMDTKVSIWICRYQVAEVSPIMILGWGYQICIYMLIFLTILMAFIGSLYVLFSGLPTYRIILGSSVCYVLVIVLFHIRKLPTDKER